MPVPLYNSTALLRLLPSMYSEMRRSVVAACAGDVVAISPVVASSAMTAVRAKRMWSFVSEASESERTGLDQFWPTRSWRRPV